MGSGLAAPISVSFLRPSGTSSRDRWERFQRELPADQARMRQLDAQLAKAADHEQLVSAIASLPAMATDAASNQAGRHR